MKRKLIICIALGISSMSQAENLLEGDVSAEAGTYFLTHGRYSNELVPYAHDTGNAFHGKASVRVDWDAKKRYVGPRPQSAIHAWFDRYISFNTPELEEGKDYTLSLYMKAAVNNFPVTLRANPRTGWQYFAPNSFYKKEIRLGTDWQRVSLTFKPLFKKNSPIKGYSIILDFGNSPAGTVWYDAAQLEKGTAPTAFRPASDSSVEIVLNADHWSHIYTAGEKVKAAVSAIVPGKSSLEITVTDYKGNVTRKTVSALSESGKVEVPLPSDRFGWFKVTAALEKDGHGQAVQSQNYLVVRPPVKTALGMRPFCGIDDDPAFDNYKQLAKLGVKRAQVSGRWRMGYRGGIENRPGEFDFSLLEFQLKRGREYGMVNKVLCGAFETPSWYFDEKEWNDPARKGQNLVLDRSKQGAWTGLLREIMTRYGGLIDEIELGQEDNGQLGINEYYKHKYPEHVKPDTGGQLWLVGGKPFDDLCDMVISGASEIRRHRPDMRIGAIRPSQGREGEHWFFVHKQFERIGKHFNIFPVDIYLENEHNYGPLKENSSRSGTLDGRFASYAHAKLLTRKYGIDQEVYISESGMFVDTRYPDNSRYRQFQAEMLVKDFLVSRAAGFTAYDYFQGLGGNTAPKLYNGYFQDNLKIQPHAAAYSAAAQLVENVEKGEYLKPDETTRIVVMKKKDGSGLAAVWAEKGFYVRMPPGMRAEDMMGNPILHAEMLELSSAPIVFFDSNYESLLAKMKKLEVAQTNFCRMLFRRTGYRTGRLKIINISNTKPLEAEVSANGNTQRILVPGGGANVCDMPVSGNTLNVEVKNLSGRGTMKQTFQVPEPTPIHRENNIIASVSTRGDIHPQDDPWVPWNGPEDLSAEFSACWNSVELKIRISVTDDKHFNKFGAETWRGDSIQIGLDPRGNGEFHEPGPGKKFGPDDLEFGAALGSDGKLYLSGSHNAADIKVTRDEENRKTLYVITIPWKNLKIKPFRGMVFGMSFLIFDDDSGQGYDYYAPVGSGIAGNKSPAKYKKFILED